jgi:amino acid transporter
VSAGSVALSLAAIQSRSHSGTPFSELFAPVFGARASAILVVTYLASSVFGIATIAAGLGQYFSYLAIPHIVVAEILIIAVFLVVNLVGIRLSGTTENVLTVIKVAGIIAVAAALCPFIRTENLLPVHAPGTTDLLKVVIIVFWPFTGFEISAIPVAETKNPAQISRALFLVMALVCAIYFSLNLSLIGAMGATELAASPAPIAEAAARYYRGTGPFVAALGIVTMLSALNAYIVAASRVLQNAAETFRIAPLATLSRRGVPAPALVVSCVLSGTLLLFSNHFEELATAAVLMTLAPYIAICASAFVLVKTPIVRAVSVLGAMLTTGILVLYLAA